jgi:deoxyribodipyrimidine photo-lyase
MEEIALIWLKRDLRLNDHAAFKWIHDHKLQYIPFFCFEPSVVNESDFDWRHWRFQYESIIDLNFHLNKLVGAKVLIFYGEVEEAILRLQKKYSIKAVVSHQETGVEYTYKRDLRFLKFCKIKSIRWIELAYHPITRGSKILSIAEQGQKWHQWVRGSIAIQSGTLN